MQRTKLTILVFAAALALMLAGCGSNRDSGGDQTAGAPALGTDPDTGIAFVGAGTCIDCHQDISFSEELVQGYLESKHVNHSTAINQGSPASCLECHDPIGDGPTIEGLIDPANVPAEGLAAVGCENCHGPGGEHFGVGPIPNFDPDFEVCGKCHQALPDLPEFHPAGLNIVENYRQSEHAEEARTSAPCLRCHSDEGFEMFVDGTRELDGENLEEALATVPSVEDDPIQCHTCHDPHETGTLRVLESDVSRDSEGTRFGRDEEGNRIRKKNFSSQFNLCTSCHQAFLEYVLDEDTGLFTYSLFYNSASPPDEGDGVNDAPFHGDETDPNVDSRSRTIVDTHFNYVDPDGVNASIDGYNINAADDNACRNCHEVHAATKFAQAEASTIATQWGSSGHADYLGEPFTHDFSSGECMKCHSGTEYARFVQGVPQDELDVEGGPRVIACVACHDLMAKTNAGEFELGATRVVEEVVFPSGAVQDLVDASNLCAECHQGRESGLTISDAIAENPGGPHSFANRHYFAAAAIRFGTDVTAGFEYEGRDYLGENTYSGALGSHPDSLTTCIGCHLRKASEETPNHTFEPNIETCSLCHVDVIDDFAQLGLPFGAANVDYDGDDVRESFQSEIDGMEELLLTAIQDYAANTLSAPIIYSAGSYPYWFNDTDADGVVDEGEANFGNRYTVFDDRLLAAAYNYHSNQDPCGDMHNYKYVLQTAYDSIDDLDNEILDNSVQGAVVPATRP